MNNKKTLENYLYQGEEVIKKAKPKASARLKGQLALLIFIALICLAGDCFFVGVSVAIGIADGKKIWMAILFVALLIIHIVPEVFWLMSIFEKQSKLINTVYVFTDRRIIIKYNLGDMVCFEELPYDCVKSVSVSGGLTSFIYNVRNIILSTSSSDKVKLFALDGWNEIESIVKEKILF